MLSDDVALVGGYAKLMPSFAIYYLLQLIKKLLI